MHKKLLAFLALLFTGIAAQAAFTPVTLTGFSNDIIANGIGAATTSTNADVDGVNYAFVAQNFQATSSSATPTYYLPNGGALTSALTAGLNFQLASYSSNNALRLTSTTTSGTLGFATATAAGEIYVLGTSGSGSSTATITVNFSNSTSQTFTNISFADWYGGTGSVNAIGRVNLTTNALEGNTSDPKLYEVKLTLNSANYGLPITGITVTRTGGSATGSVLVIMAATINDVCSGTPNGGTTTGPSSLCSGGIATLGLTGTSNAAGITYQWQQYNGSAWVSVTGGSGANTATYTTPALATTTQYRCQITCGASTQVAYSTPLTVTISTSIIPPYTEDFESITTANQLPNCMTATNVASIVYTYLTAPGSYNRTNHTPGGNKFAAFRWSCNDYMFTPALSLTGGVTYTFSFWYITDGYSGWTTLSAKYGTTATAAGMVNTIGTALSGPMNTSYQQFTGTFTPATTGIYYVAIYCNANSTPWYLSVDDLNITAPGCSGTPTAGTAAASVSGACATTNYTLSLSGNSSGTGITYQWQSAASSTGPWTNVGTNATYTATGQSATTFYRCIVTCTTSSQSATSNVVTVNQLPGTVTVANNGPICSGSTLNLTTTAANTGLTYSWTGPNSFTSTAQNPSISGATTAAGGLYTLTASSGGCSGTFTTTAVVNPSPTGVTATVNTPICAGSTLNLTGNSTSTGVSYGWTGPNSFSSATQSPSITNATTAATGTYTLTATLGSCTTTATAAATVNTTPATVTASSNTPVCQNGNLNLTGSSSTAGVTYSWSGPNSYTSATQNPSISNVALTAAGTYTLTASIGTCAATATTAVVVNPTPVISSAVGAGPTTCFGSSGTITLSGLTPSTTYTLHYSKNAVLVTPYSITTTAAGQYVITNLTIGTYSNIYVTTAAGCSSAIVGPVTLSNPIVVPTPTTSSNSPVCTGATLNLTASSMTGSTYSWTGPNGFTSTTQNPVLPNVAAVNAGTYSVIANYQGCLSQAGTTTVVVNPLPTATAAATTPTTVCQGTQVTLQANTGNGLNYQWQINNGNIPTATNATYNPTATGNYTVLVTNANGCARQSAPAIAVTIVAPPVSLISYNTPISFCEGNSVTLIASAGSNLTYQWYRNNTALTGATNSTYTATLTGSYSLRETNSFGCTDLSSPVGVTVFPVLNPIINRNGNTLSAPGYTTYQWYFNNTPIAGGTTASIPINGYGYYFVIATDANGCTSKSALAWIQGTSVGNQGLSDKTRIYPNPASNMLYIDAPVAVQVRILSMSGQVVLQSSGMKEINLSQLADGVYSVSLLTEDGALIRTERLVKAAR